MTENTLDINVISLHAQLEAISAAMEMHIKRSEALAVEAQQIERELEAIEQGKEK